MTSFNIPTDDAAIITKSKPTERPVQPAAPYPKVQPVTPHNDVMQAPPRQARKQDERRRKDRRRKENPVLLDTRTGHDRRNAAAESEVEIQGESSEPQKTGIDLYT